MVLTFSVNIQHYFVPKIKEINFLAQWNVDTRGMKGNKHRMRECYHVHRRVIFKMNQLCFLSLLSKTRAVEM